MSEDFLSFPEGVLCENSIKLPILFEDEFLIAVSKQCNIYSTRDKFSPDSQRNIIQHINSFLSKPEFVNHEIKAAIAAYELENCMSGVFVFAKNNRAGEWLRNVHGSNLINFTFTFVTIQNDVPKDKEIICDLPIAKHFCKDVVVISHKTGKKCSTKFKFVEQIERYEIWQARCSFFRKHQLRAHTADFGLPIFGENLYAMCPIPLANQLKRTFKLNRKDDESNVVYSGLAAHLQNVSFIDNERNLTYNIECPLPNKFKIMVKFLKNSKK